MPDRLPPPIALGDVARRGPQRGQAVLTDASAHVDAVLTAVAALDPVALGSALDDAFAAGSVEHVIQLVLMPLLREIGDQWESGRLGVAHEHLASGVLARRLSALALEVEPGTRHTAVLACPPGERHDLVLSCFALLLQREGWRVLLLGADTPTAAIAVTCRQSSADLLVLAGSRPSVFTSRSASMRRLCAQYRTALGGGGARLEVARELGAALLPPDPVQAVDVAARLVREPGPGPASMDVADDSFAGAS